MKVSMILGWCFSGAAILIGIILLVLFLTYQVDGTLEFNCALGDQSSCNALQLHQTIHVVEGILAFVCFLALIGFLIWAGVATADYNHAEKAKAQQQEAYARWYWWQMSQRRR